MKSPNSTALSHAPYLQKRDLQWKTTPVHRPMFQQSDNRLMMMSENLQVKAVQCRFLLEENEYLNQKLKEIETKSTKQSNSVEKLEKSVQVEQKQKKSIEVQTQPNQQQTEQLKKLCELHKREIEQLTSDKNRVIEMLNRSLVEALQGSSTLLREKQELSHRLQENTVALKEIEQLYVNAKQYIFKGDVVQDKMETSRISIEIESELQATKHLLHMKELEVQQKDEIIKEIRILFAKECQNFKNTVEMMQKQMNKNVQNLGTNRQDKAIRSIIGQCHSLSKQFSSLSPQLQKNTLNLLQQMGLTLITRRIDIEKLPHNY